MHLLQSVGSVFNKPNTLWWLNVPDQSMFCSRKYPRGKFCQEILLLPAVIEWA